MIFQHQDLESTDREDTGWLSRVLGCSTAMGCHGGRSTIPMPASGRKDGEMPWMRFKTTHVYQIWLMVNVDLPSRPGLAWSPEWDVYVSLRGLPNHPKWWFRIIFFSTFSRPSLALFLMYRLLHKVADTISNKHPFHSPKSMVDQLHSKQSHQATAGCQPWR